MTVDNEIRKALKDKKALLGSRSALRAARNGRVVSLIHARNVPSKVTQDLNHYATVSGVEIKEFPGNSLELGELCGKPFGVVLLGIAK